MSKTSRRFAIDQNTLEDFINWCTLHDFTLDERVEHLMKIQVNPEKATQPDIEYIEDIIEDFTEEPEEEPEEGDEG